VIEDKVWNGIATGASVGAVAATRPLVARGWRAATGSEPPGNPVRDEVSWRDAIVWAMVSGAVVGVARLVAQRAAAGVWNRVRGEYPSGLAPSRP
jgi:hypothetical protein